MASNQYAGNMKSNILPIIEVNDVLVSSDILTEFFCCDLELEPVKANYITDDMSFDIFGDGVPAKIRVTEKGIVFHRNDEICTFNFDSKLTETVFRAAHRRDGCYTFSPVGDMKGRVLAAGGTKLRSFSPHRDELLFSASL